MSRVRTWIVVHRRRLIAAGAVACVLPLLALAATFIPIDPAPYLDTRSSGELRDRSGELLYTYLNDADQWCFPREADAISPWLVQATIAAEDQRFYAHAGVDPVAVLRAASQNLQEQDIVSGASTLTMQVVKMTEHSPRTLRGKAAQAFNALRLERGVTKEHILIAYLNRAPYGLNLVGVEAAARRYFGKPASELTLPEAALLAGLPKSPAAYQPLRHPERAKARRDYVLTRMHDEGYIDAAELVRAQNARLGAAWHEYPRLSPHLAEDLRERVAAGRTLHVTLNARLQARLEALLPEYLKQFNGEITNAAVVVVDVESAEILARVASADFFETPGGGQVDLCRQPRSPGSTLKPFTYGLALERNLLYPSERLLDDTLDYGQYNPENFDGEYNGLVSAAEALQLSLNVPALTTLGRVGVPAFSAYLRGIGLTTLTESPGHYGLGLTLGNCEVRLDELAAAYRMLADLGEYRPLRIFRDAPEPEGKRALSRGTALMLYRMLDQPFPRELGNDLVQAQGFRPRVCWKTGTSTGYHDAWAFAFNRHYVVGVWLGNNDGKYSAQLVGATAALPAARIVFRLLEPKTSPAWPDFGADLVTTKVCAASGLPVSRWCSASREAMISRSQYVHRRCDVHRRDAGEQWPGDARSWNLANIRNPVTIAPNADAAAKRRVALRIKSPPHNGQYVATGLKHGDRIRFRASLDTNTTLYWYEDDRFVGVSSPQTPLLKDLVPGDHVLTCMAPSGEMDQVRYSVLSPSD